MKLTVGMASYKNFADVWWTVQSLRLQHELSGCEILVVDNYGDAKLEGWITAWGGGDVRYIRATEVQGTSAPRDLVFREARGTWTICIDSHVMLPAGVVAAFLGWAGEHPDCTDLLHGPMLYDDLQTMAVCMDDEWRDNMWGTWRNGEPIDGEIPMHGLGLFGCRTDSWLGFNPGFRGFGGEEGYIHEKYRQAGRKVLSLPFLKWAHKFNDGVPYPLRMSDRIKNYVTGFEELGLDKAPLVAHFGAQAVAATAIAQDERVLQLKRRMANGR